MGEKTRAVDILASKLDELITEVKAIRKVVEKLVSNAVGGVETRVSSVEGLSNVEIDVSNIEIPYSTHVINYVVEKFRSCREKLVEVLGEGVVKVIENILQQVQQQVKSRRRS